MHFKRILVTLDGSTVGEAAVALAEPLANSARVDLLRVVPVVVRGGRPINTRIVRDQVDEATAYIETMAVRLRDKRIDGRAQVRYGLPVEEILKFAAVEQSDLIVMTTHGRTGIRRWVVGSITEQVLRSATVPLLVRKSFERAPTVRPIRKIMVALDGAETAERILPHAEALGRAYGADLLLVSVVATPDDDRMRYLEGMSSRLRGRDVYARARVITGEPSREIQAAIEREQPDLVAMATHGRVGVSRWILGSVVETVLRSVETPLLLLRVAEGKEAEGHGNGNL